MNEEPTLSLKRGLDLAVSEIKRGDIEAGKARLSQILSVQPDNILALLWMTKCIQEPAVQLGYFSRVLQLDPRNVHAGRGMERIDEMFSRQGATAPDQNRPDLANGHHSTQYQPTRGFQPRFVSALGGIIAAFGLAFPWVQEYSRVSGNTFISNSMNGLQTSTGIVILLAAVGIIAISLLHHTLTLRPSSPFAAIVATFALFLAVPAFVYESGDTWWFLTPMQDASWESAGMGVGITMIGLLLAIWGGLGINPGRGKADWSSWLSVGLMLLLGLILGVSGILLPCGLPMILLGGLSVVTIIRGRRAAAV